MADKYRVLKGIRYPASKTIRDKIRAGKVTSSNIGIDPITKKPIPVTDWKRHKAGAVVTIPADLIPEFKRRGAIKKEG